MITSVALALSSSSVSLVLWWLPQSAVCDVGPRSGAPMDLILRPEASTVEWSQPWSTVRLRAAHVVPSHCLSLHLGGLDVHSSCLWRRLAHRMQPPRSNSVSLLSVESSRGPCIMADTEPRMPSNHVILPEASTSRAVVLDR